MAVGPLHVAMASPWPPWRAGDGTAKHTHELASHLQGLPGVRVTVISVDAPGRPASLPYDVVLADSPGLARMRARASQGGVGRTVLRQLHDAAFNRHAVRLANAAGADVFHRQGASAPIDAGDLPVVITLHNGTLPIDEQTPVGWRHRLARPLGALDRARRMGTLRRGLGRATALVCVSEHIQDKVVRRLGLTRTTHHIANGCPDPGANVSKPEARRRLGVAPAERIVLFVGRLSSEKRVERLLALLDHGVRLVFVGTGPQEARLRERAKTAGNLSVLGFQEEAAKDLWLRAADVLALPSGYFEGNPIVMMEALKRGTPVYGTHATWLPEPLRRFGCFGEDVRLALDAMRIDASAAPALVPGWDEVAAQTLQVYRSVLGRA